MSDSWHNGQREKHIGRGSKQFYGNKAGRWAKRNTARKARLTARLAIRRGQD